MVRTVAKERMERLFYLAERSVVDGGRYSNNYVRLIEKISAHYKVPVPRSMRNRICKHCMTVLVPGLNCRVTVASSKGYVGYKCTACGKELHVHYK